MITDEVKIKVFAGKGGRGVVAFDKIKMSLGPTGGRGGNGGNIYFRTVSDLTALNRYRNKKEYPAGDGKNGKTNLSTGHNGGDLILNVPVGSVLHNISTGERFEMIEAGKTVLAAKGGLGGRGNYFFRSATNTSPQEYEEGKPGEEFDFLIELRLIADIGLIGLPNAGKSSLLNELTKAEVKVANYSFTTLEPNLGALDSLIIADIPGLIEGASAGKGLGIKFLRHIRRTKALAHCVSLESDDLLRDYETVRSELQKYSSDLTAKKEIILLTKSDSATKEKIQESLELFKSKAEIIAIVSIHDWESLENLRKIFIELAGH